MRANIHGQAIEDLFDEKDLNGGNKTRIYCISTIKESVLDLIAAFQ